jgi:hemerythrin
MPRIKWDDKYLIGIEQFDDEHKHLVELLDKIIDVFMSYKREDGKSQEILDSLTAYVTTHFANEEKWMLDCSYPKMKEHVFDHNRFIFRLSEFKHIFRNGDGHLTIDIISFLRVWILTHISIIDSDLGTFCREGNILVKVIGQ